MGSWEDKRKVVERLVYERTVPMGNLYREVVSEELERRLNGEISPLEARTLLDRVGVDIDRVSEIVKERFEPILGRYDEIVVLTYVGKRAKEGE